MNIYLDLFLTFSKIGAFTFGGGYAMVPMIEKDVVTNKKWIDKDEFMELISMSYSSPGVLAVNISIFVGHKIRGVRGSLVTTLATVLPSFIILLLIAMFFSGIRENQTVESIFKGIRPAVVALIVVPVIKMARDINLNRYTITIPLITIFLVWYLGISPIYVISVGAIGGLAYHFSHLKKVKKD